MTLTKLPPKIRWSLFQLYSWRKQACAQNHRWVILLHDLRIDVAIGIFPSTWTIARVMPAFKKDDKSSPSNYRPISLLSCIGKVMERAVYKYTYNFIFEHSLLCAYQSGFIRGHSTLYQLLEMYHRVCPNLDERLSTILIFCDISKALAWGAY